MISRGPVLAPPTNPGQNMGGGLAVQPPGPPTNTPAPTAIPLDAEGRIALQQAAAARNTYLNQLLQQHQADQLSYGQTLHSYQEQHPLDEATLGGQEAGNGMLFSTGYGQQLGLLNQKYNETLGNLGTNEAQSISQLKQDRNQYNQEYGTDVNAIQEAAAQRLAANKATLGLTKGGTLTSKQLSKLLNGQ